MAFAQSFDNQSSDLRINVMVVDDDPVFLGVVSRMLEKSKYRDPSFKEISVIAVQDPIEALSTLKTQRHNIDLIVTDYYMPHMNGLQLKKQITREFGNIPVIVMSSDSNIEHESLACGAKCFLPKPIRPTDIPQIYQVALTYKRNDKSILWTEPNYRDTDVSIPQQIQLLAEQANVLKTNKRFSPISDSRPVNSSNGSYVGSGENRKRKSNGGSDDDSRPLKKPKIKWTDGLHDLFLQAIRYLGLDKAVPKKILEYMNLPYLTRENIASHLQKYRIFLRKVAEQGFSCSRMLPTKGIDSIFLQAHLRDPYYNNNAPSSSLYDTTINNRSFYSKSGQGYGQSRLLSNTAEPVRFNQMPYNYMNRSSTYEPRGIRSNLTIPTKSNLSFPIQPSQNEGRRSLFEPTVMANKTVQTSQVMGFGHGLSAINGTSFNNNMVSSYERLTPTQPGIMSYENLTPSQPGVRSYVNSTFDQPGMNNHGSLTPDQQGMRSYRSLTSNQLGVNINGSFSQTPNQPGMSSYGISTSNQQRMNNNGSLTADQHGMSSYGRLTSNQLGMSSRGSLYPNQPGLNSYGSVTYNASVNIHESLTPNQPGPSNFSYGMQMFLNNENTAYKPQAHDNATTQPNLEIPQLENLSLCDYLNNTDELFCNISNLQIDHNKQQEEAVSTNKFELPANFETELNQFFSLEENGDGNFVNINQGRSDGETSNIVAAPETNYPVFNMNPNHEQEQGVPDFVDWSSLDPKDFANEYDFVDSLLTNDMN
ncbi:unnamed protein product [Brassica oleracea]